MTRSTQATEVASVGAFEGLLNELTGIAEPLPAEISRALRDLIASIGPALPVSASQVSDRFFQIVNRKLAINRQPIALMYSQAAARGFTFNYHQKRRLALSIDSGRLDLCSEALADFGLTPDHIEGTLRQVVPASQDDTRHALFEEAHKPSKLRKAHNRDVSIDVLASCTGPLVWALWPVERLYSAFGGGGDGELASDYLAYLKGQSPDLFNRSRTLSIRFVEADEAAVAAECRSAFSGWLEEEFARISNHGYVALVLEVDPERPSGAWLSVLDATLFAERFKEIRLKQMFFRSATVAQETTSHIPELDEKTADFGVLNEGFTYKDVFVLTDASGVVTRLVLLMQKNVRDETVVPCPDCRGVNVEGNSYSSLGVKSWECQNPLCPARSIYNRGRRFQFKSVLSQAAIEDPQSTVPVKSVRRWQRDVLPFESDQEIFDTLISHHSIWGDGVAVVNAPSDVDLRRSGRAINREQRDEVHSTSAFWSAAFFRRFPISSTTPSSRPGVPSRQILAQPFQVIHGDSNEILKSIADSTFDRAITSPPYFNAREYSQWPNLYTYLFDMAANASEVFRVLKPGGIYAYNIFDYFDNERVVVFSDMGKKRLPLAALMTNVFLRIGFELDGVIPWDKGEIQGKRGFNAGNYSPFYQSPFNCWEHVLLLRKPSNGTQSTSASGIPRHIAHSVAPIGPVIKMVGGTNTYGHTAPYPLDLVNVLLSGLEPDALVLDPYAGSGTTARAALARGIRSVMIEQDPTYAELCQRTTEEFANRQAFITDRSGALRT